MIVLFSKWTGMHFQCVVMAVNEYNAFRGVSDSGLESAQEYEFGSFLLTIDGDSGSGSFQVWSRFHAGIGSTTGTITELPF